MLERAAQDKADPAGKGEPRTGMPAPAARGLGKKLGPQSRLSRPAPRMSFREARSARREPAEHCASRGRTEKEKRYLSSTQTKTKNQTADKHN